ncbi:MAG: penicillin acylase family protein, partial [Parahaliea sp.]
HVTANDWGSLGYGFGNAYAKENYCVVMREFERAAGRSRSNENEDGLMLVYNTADIIQQHFVEGQPQRVVDLATGYAAGLNRYLAETGADTLRAGEQDCPAREVDVIDVGRLMHRSVLRASSVALAEFMNFDMLVTENEQVPTEPATLIADHSAARPTAADEASPATPRKLSDHALLASLDPERIHAGLAPPPPETMGSNAYAIGAEAAQGERGLLLGNPHFPWHGNLRWFMVHLTMGDEYDVMGATLAGIPIITIGFNKDLAWSHTVSTGQRFTLYELTLDPADRTRYLYDGEYRDIEELRGARNPDNIVSTEIYSTPASHYGPILSLGDLSPALGGWPNQAGTAIVYRDANLYNMRGLEQWIRMGQASNLGEFKEALKLVGLPWVNTIAADRYGDAFYGDISVVPHVTAAQLSGGCVTSVVQQQLTGMGYFTLDGSKSACGWGSDEGSAEGIFGYNSLPKLETRDYAANANDSYWLANPRQLLTGYSPLIGREQIAQSLRTRQTFHQAEQRRAGNDDLGSAGFNIDNIRKLMYSASNYTAELVVNSLVSLCRNVDNWSDYGANSTTGALTDQACEILANWDQAYRIDSVGSHIFHEFWRAFDGTDKQWAMPFSMSDAVNTPRELNVGDASVADAALKALVSAVTRLNEASIALDAPWGEVQFDEKNGVRYGIHGGSGRFMFSAIQSDLVAGKGYANITTGNSYIQAVTWDDTHCPVAYGTLTYSQSTNPASAHYADATELYSKGGWIDLPFCSHEQDTQELSRITLEN